MKNKIIIPMLALATVACTKIEYKQTTAKNCEISMDLAIEKIYKKILNTNSENQCEKTNLMWEMLKLSIKKDNIKYIKNLEIKNLKDMYGLTPIHYAVTYRNKTKILQALSECKNFDINVKDNMGNTALHYAAEFCPENTQKLLDLGAKKEIYNEDYCRPLDIASIVENKNIIEILQK